MSATQVPSAASCAKARSTKNHFALHDVYAEVDEQRRKHEAGRKRPLHDCPDDAEVCRIHLLPPSAAARVFNRVHQADIRVGVLDRTGLLPGINDSRVGLAGDRLCCAPVLERLDENHLHVVPPNRLDDLGKVRRRR